MSTPNPAGNRKNTGEYGAWWLFWDLDLLNLLRDSTCLSVPYLYRGERTHNIPSREATVSPLSVSGKVIHNSVRGTETTPNGIKFRWKSVYSAPLTGPYHITWYYCTRRLDTALVLGDINHQIVHDLDTSPVFPDWKLSQGCPPAPCNYWPIHVGG